MSAQARLQVDPAQRRRVRRSALLLGLIVLAFYIGFIVFSVLHGHQ